MMKKFKMKITTDSNEPVVKAKADKLDDFTNLLTKLKKKFE